MHLDLRDVLHLLLRDDSVHRAGVLCATSQAVCVILDIDGLFLVPQSGLLPISALLGGPLRTHGEHCSCLRVNYAVRSGYLHDLSELRDTAAHGRAASLLCCLLHVWLRVMRL